MLVGRSHECDYPEPVKKLPQVTFSSVDGKGTSGQIHAQVQAAYRKDEGPIRALGIYSIDTDLLRELRPDVILTQSQCEVCAVSAEQVEEAVAGSLGYTPRIVSLSPDRLEDVWQDILRVGEVLGVSQRAEEVVEGLRSRIAAIAGRVTDLPNPTVVCVEWIEPLMMGGNWVPDLVAIAGGVNLLGEAGKHSGWAEWDVFHEADPDVIVLMPCGFDLEKTVEESRRLFKHPGFRNYKAVKSRRVYAVDGNSYFNRPGPRLADSAEILAKIFHGEAARFGYEGSAWRRL